MSDGDTSLQSLLVELITASRGSPDANFVGYVRQRLDEELNTQEEAYELIVRLASFGGMAVAAWAEDTDRDPDAVMRTIALGMYTGDDT